MILQPINKAEALRYMGHHGKDVPPVVAELVERCEKQLAEAVKPDYTFRCFDIEINDSGVLIKGTKLVLKGNDIKQHLEGCKKAVLMCATLGTDTDRLIKKLSVTDVSESYAADALASAAIEQVCDNAEKEIREKFSDMNMTWRFSPGYGDFPIEQQRDFLIITDASKRIGLNLSDSGMMIPSKSVTAVIGLSENEIKQKKRGCSCCNMAETCGYRKRGEHCGF